jgi:hypothetical protein
MNVTIEELVALQRQQVGPLCSSESLLAVLTMPDYALEKVAAVSHFSCYKADPGALLLGA